MTPCQTCSRLLTALYAGAEQWDAAPILEQLEARRADATYQAALDAYRQHMRTCRHAEFNAALYAGTDAEAAFGDSISVVIPI